MKKHLIFDGTYPDKWDDFVKLNTENSKKDYEMVKHLSIRLAWHENGWNGHICEHPCGNSYCIGQHSYPGSAVAENRDVEFEKVHPGEPISKYPCKVACSLSANAFGAETIQTLVKKPSWWKPTDAEDLLLEIPPYTACTWPYDAAYNQDVYQNANPERFDNDKRFENARNYFKNFECGKSLAFYYAGYSNPFSEEDSDNFVIVGISRIKQIHDFLFYNNATEDIRKRYANGLVWQKPITSCYPDEGFCIPYWKYADDEDILNRLVVKPANREPFKYASREVPADDAIDVVNQLIGVVDTLIELDDKTEDWHVRRSWLTAVLNELWTARGPYPGLPSVLEFLNLSKLESSYLNLSDMEKMKKFYMEFVEFMNSNRDDVLGITIENAKETRRFFALLGDDDEDDDFAQKLLLEILPRFDLTKDQIENIMKNRSKYSVSSSYENMFKNPYEIFEQYKSADIGDEISFYKIDNGVLAAPQYGIGNLMDVAATERLRALCVDELNRIPAHSFGKAKTILEVINTRLDRMPEWKRAAYKLRYFSIDKDVWEKAIHQRKDDESGDLYLYLKNVYEDERTVEEVLRTLAERDDISLTMTITRAKFKEKLKRSDSDIEENAAEEYEKILDSQADVCMQIFAKPICVLSGAAGTGKTTVIQALLENISRVHGRGTSFLLMAPTGKAAERIKNQTGKPSMTIHSFLAKNGWINDNYTFKKTGGIKAADVNTLIIDECSMIDLNLFATLVRSINWNSVQRLILVGDPNQLPAIGRGRVFADIIDCLKKEYPNNVGVLKENVRQLVNRIKGYGNGILDLANIFIQERQKNMENTDESVLLKAEKEKIFKKILENGNGDVDKDLGVYFWKSQEDLELTLKEIIIQDMKKISGSEADGSPRSLNMLWQETLKDESSYYQPEKIQLISPYRGEFYGTGSMNLLMQSTFNKENADALKLDGISMYDKVIQKINRPKSNKASAYSFAERANVDAEIYNGEIGLSRPYKFDTNWKYNRPKRFQVKFSNESRNDFLYNYGIINLRDVDGNWIPKQDIEENLELAYAISVHKSQGSEFDYVYIVIPKRDSHLLSMELLYTALTRAQKKVTLFLQEDISTLTSLSSIEKSAVRKINSSVFDFKPLPEELLYTKNWYKENKKLATLSEYFVRSKSEVIIANLLTQREIPFEYETPLYAPDGSFYLPDFTVKFKGETYYWEHWGRMDLPNYRAHTEEKQKWYAKHFPGKLIETYEDDKLTTIVEKIIADHI